VYVYIGTSRALFYSAIQGPLVLILSRFVFGAFLGLGVLYNSVFIGIRSVPLEFDDFELCFCKFWQSEVLVSGF
jgi:tryptophan-rich sensory protein